MLKQMRRISVALTAVMLMSLLLPVIALGASKVQMYYDSSSGQVSGMVYQNLDQGVPNVSVSLYTSELIDITDQLTIGEVTTTENVHYLQFEGVINSGLQPTYFKVGDTIVGDVSVTNEVYSYEYDAVPAPPNFNFGVALSSDGTRSITFYPMLDQEFDLVEYRIYQEDELAATFFASENFYIWDKKFTGPASVEFSVSAVDMSGNESEQQHFTRFIPGVFEDIVLHFDQKPAGYVMQPGDDIASFVPSANTMDNVSIQISFPHFVPFSLDPNLDILRTTIGELTPSDFVLYKASEPEQEININDVTLNIEQGEVTLNLNTALEAGVEYILKLSDMLGDNMIILPDVDSKRVYTFFQLYNSFSLDIRTVDYYYSTITLGDPAPDAPVMLNATAGNGSVALSWEANTEDDFAGYHVYIDGQKANHSLLNVNSYTADSLTNGKTYSFYITAVDEGGNESLPSITVFSTPTAPNNDTDNPVSPIVFVPISGPEATPEAAEDVDVIDPERLQQGEDGKVVVETSDDKKEVILPAAVLDVIGDHHLAVTTEGLAVEIPSVLLHELRSLVSEAELGDAQVSFKFDKVSAANAQSLLEQSSDKNNTKLTSAGEIYEFSLSIVDQDGNETKLTQFSQSIILKLKINENANEDLIGVYYVSNDGDLEYVGGEIIDGQLVAAIDHFSKYAVLEFDKAYSDVSAEHWAADVIKIMSAKHVVTGINQDEFAPQNNMTRAEFAALITRSLGLTASAPASFSDVDESSWYFAAVAAAAEAGIITGRTPSIFAPNDFIKREEMAAMIVRAYELKTAVKLPIDTEASFTDRNVASEWALPYIDAASHAGIIQGRNNHTFAPLDRMTRAEGVQIAYNLLLYE